MVVSWEKTEDFEGRKIKWEFPLGNNCHLAFGHEQRIKDPFNSLKIIFKKIFSENNLQKKYFIKKRIFFL